MTMSKTGSNVHFSSKRNTWETPQDLFDKLDQEFHFQLDVCALPENAKCKKYFNPAENGLKQKWKGICWMNPPYGREIGKWMKKAYESARAGATVVCLVPARTDTAWWRSTGVSRSTSPWWKGCWTAAYVAGRCGPTARRRRSITPNCEP